MKYKSINKLYSLLALDTLQRNKYHILLYVGIVFSCVSLLQSTSTYFSKPLQKQQVLGAKTERYQTNIVGTTKALRIKISITPTEIPTITPTPHVTATPKPTSLPIPTIGPTNKPSIDTSQYTAQKIDDVTWRVSNIKSDSNMATVHEIFDSLNTYRQAHGVSVLTWNQALADFAQGRADLFNSQKSLDSHAGFMSFMNNDGFNKIGFNGLGENSAYLAGPMSGDRIIKEIFGADSAHDGNQLNPGWTDCGVGLNGVAINVNFGKGKR